MKVKELIEALSELDPEADVEYIADVYVAVTSVIVEEGKVLIF